MGNSTGNMNTLNAAFKIQYADKMADLIPDMAPLMSKLPFVANKQRHGAAYVQPVVLSMDHGFTCHGPADNVLILNAPVLHNIQQAQITASAYSGRSWISTAALSRAAEGPQAFIDGTGHIVESLMKSFTHMYEFAHWYGGVGMATVVGATAPLAVNKVEITAAEAAAFGFLGGEGMPVEIFDSSSTSLVLSTEITAVQIGQDYQGNASDKITLTLASVSGLSNGTTYVIYRKGYNGLEHKGLKYMLTQDNVFGINGANFGMWRANRYAAASASLSFSLLSAAIARAIGRGLSGPLAGYCNPKAFRQLFPDYFSIGDVASSSSTDTRQSNPKARKFDNVEQTKNLVHGTKDVKIFVDSIEATIQSTEFVKGGDCFMLDQESFMRVGSTAPTFNIPGMNEGTYFIPRQDASCAELRIFGDEAIFTSELNKSLIITGIGI